MLYRTVGDLMARDVATVRPGPPVKGIAAPLADCGVSAVPVLDDRCAPLGLVSEADLLRKQADRSDPHGDTAPLWGEVWAGADAETAEGLMTAPAVTAKPDWSVPEAARAMVTAGSR
jgi:CBS domain-containing protein